MASLPVTPPEPLSFSNPEEWPTWIRRFEGFRSVSVLDEKSTERAVKTKKGLLKRKAIGI